MNAHLLPWPYNRPRHQSPFQPFYAYIANLLSKIHNLTRINPPLSSPPSNPITIVCISDTHNATPSIPAGDVLIHAGDLTHHGSLVELQAQLTWLKGLEFRYKIVIAGNHDLILDEAFREKSPLRNVGGGTKADIEWGGITYLQNQSVILNLDTRSLKVYGAPQTPEFGIWAFQYPPIRDVGSGRIPDDADVVICHGRPLGFCNVDRKGDGYLLRELRRVKPRLLVSGHIHDGFGEIVMVHDGVEGRVEGVVLSQRGLGGVVELLVWVCWACLKWVLGLDMGKAERVTRIVNAAVAPGEMGKSMEEARVVRI